VTSRVAILVVNTAPVAGPDHVYRPAGEGIIIDAANLLVNDIDADGDRMSIVGVSASSSHVGSVARTGRYISYSPPASFNGDDTFNYTVADGRGGVAVGLVTVSVTESLMHISNIEPLPGHQVTLAFEARANQNCTVLFTPSLGNAWVSVTNYPAVPTNRVILFVTPASGLSGFYRLRSP
jgi:hypothetical protein